MENKKSNIFTNTFVLVAVTIVAVSLLALVNQITRGPIEKAELDAQAKVYQSVFSQADSFERLEASVNVEASCVINDTLKAIDSEGNALGYVISSTSPSGYGGDVNIAVGINNDGVIVGFDIVSHKETAGLGSKCTDQEYKEQFVGKKAEAIAYSKTGAALDNEIDAISGATITTNATVEAVNAAIDVYNYITKGE